MNIYIYKPVTSQKLWQSIWWGPCLKAYQLPMFAGCSLSATGDSNFSEKSFTVKQVLFWIRKIYYALTNLVFEKSILLMFAFLIWMTILWQEFWQGFDDWHDSNYLQKVFDNILWHAFTKIIFYWYPNTYCKLV